MKQRVIAFSLMVCAMQANSSDKEPPLFTAEDNIYQLAPSAALANGLYKGTTRFDSMLQVGDFGLGALNAIDGEVILLEGKIYQASHRQGRLREVAGNELSPFFYVKKFREDLRFSLTSVRDMDHLTAQLDALLPTPNLPYAIRLDGKFTQIKLRSVPPQRPPYPPISEVVKQQHVFNINNIQGTLVAFRFPTFLDSVSGSGYHFHFVSTDRLAGGHLLDLRAEMLMVSMDIGRGINLILPDDPTFYAADLELSADDASKIYHDAIRPMK